MMKDGDEDEGVCGAEGRLKKRKGRRGEWAGFLGKMVAGLDNTDNTFVPQPAKPPSSPATTLQGGNDTVCFEQKFYYTTHPT